MMRFINTEATMKLSTCVAIALTIAVDVAKYPALQLGGVEIESR